MGPRAPGRARRPQQSVINQAFTFFVAERNFINQAFTFFVAERNFINQKVIQGVMPKTRRELDRDIKEALANPPQITLKFIETVFDKLPEGWILEPIGPAGSESAKRYLLLLSPLRHMATLDLSDRSIRLGFSTRGPALHFGYHGSDWSTSMLADAIHEVRRLDAKRAPR